MAEAAVRRLLPKNEHIVLGWIGAAATLTGLSQLGGKKKKEEVPTAKPADDGLYEMFKDSPEICDAMGLKKPAFKPIGNVHGTPLRLSIYAPPGGGKGTQCANIVQKYGVVQFSTGDALRAQVKAGTPIGQKAKSFMDSGALVPNDVIESVIKTTVEEDPKINANGYILDGVCRTGETSQFVMKAGLMPHLNIVLDVPDDEVVRRISGRRIDPVTGASYHDVFVPPPAEIVHRLIQRSDDTEAVVRDRLNNYKSNMEASLEPYPSDTVVRINGLGKPAEVWARIDALLTGTKAGVTAARTRAAINEK
eukprot:TRINITY_DN1457_c0_g1_i1.p1 TRINITY_DN1457_c0_g1~~TRINITY_DN1457_c0_g1_i1.p1  ORF type:complete len:307 (+),score=93.62 TRINITY_DN1457_c0_g1_i1:173-1093(+)